MLVFVQPMFLPTWAKYIVMQFAPNLGVTSENLRDARTMLMPPLRDRLAWKRLRPLCGTYIPEYDLTVISPRSLNVIMRCTAPREGSMWMIASEYSGIGYFRTVYSDGVHFVLVVEV